jgi:ABC-type amino acid transport substrate-binding protein
VTGSLLDRVQSRGAIRVGYFEDSLPYVFVNTRGALVGFDVEMALQLARDLHVSAEFVRVDRAVLNDGIDPALCDVIMSGVAITADRAARTQFTTPYLDETLALIVPDHRAADFAEWSQVRAMGPLRLGVPEASALVDKVHEQLPEAVAVPLKGMDDIFTPRNPPLDAAIATAERGSAYTILHPEYAVGVPRPRPFKVPLAYAIAGRDAALTTMLNTWIELQRKNGTVDELFGHWILGQNITSQPPRWSVMRDVLHWVR